MGVGDPGWERGVVWVHEMALCIFTDLPSQVCECNHYNMMYWAAPLLSVLKNIKCECNLQM